MVILLMRDGSPYVKKSTGRMFVWPFTEDGLMQSERVLRAMCSGPMTKRFKWALKKVEIEG